MVNNRNVKKMTDKYEEYMQGLIDDMEDCLEHMKIMGGCERAIPGMETSIQAHKGDLTMYKYFRDKGIK